MSILPGREEIEYPQLHRQKHEAFSAMINSFSELCASPDSS